MNLFPVFIMIIGFPGRRGRIHNIYLPFILIWVLLMLLFLMLLPLLLVGDLALFLTGSRPTLTLLVLGTISLINELRGMKINVRPAGNRPAVIMRCI